jgi:hypothetical protein
MSECPNCERYRESAKNWRHKAYELSGHPLPWEGGDTWVGLTDEEVKEIYTATEIKVDENWRTGDKSMMFPATLYEAIEAKLKEKNSG